MKLFRLCLSGLYTCTQFLKTQTMTEVAQRLSLLPLISPQLQDWAQSGGDVLATDSIEVRAIHTCVAPVAAQIEIVDPFGTSHQTNIALIRTCTTVGAASH